MSVDCESSALRAVARACGGREVMAAAGLHPRLRMTTAAAAKDKDEGILIGPVTQDRLQDVLNHVTPIFLRDEPLSKCFPPCKTGAREKEFRKYATNQLRSGLCVMAVDAATQKVVGSCLCRPVSRAEVMAADGGSYDEDALLRNVVQMLVSVHRELDLFSRFAVEEVFELGLASTEPSHTGRGLGQKLFRAGLELGAKKGFKVIKADCTGTGSAKACQRAGLTAIHKLDYDTYTPGGIRVFADRGVGNPCLTVCVARVQNKEPYILPLEQNKL